MIASRPIYCMARLTLQALSAHGIHSGQGDTTHDVLLVREANGLPAIPGSSLAGVLRHSFRSQYGAAATGQLFGQLGSDARPSWLSVSWALVHDGGNQPCEGLLTPEELQDPLLQVLLDSKPLVRQRVRLDHTGTASDSGKFDVTLIPAGVRYTSWLGYWCDGSEESRQHWQNLLQLLSSQQLRLGHGTRSGSGLFSVSALSHARWDLRTAEGHAAYANRPRHRRQTQGLQTLAKDSPAEILQVVLQLESEGGWRIGGGERPLTDYAKEPDLLPQHELLVQWNGDKASFDQHVHLLPGSAVKGAVRHRLAYHYRCLTGEFAGTGSSAQTEDCPAVSTLFGHATDDQGQAGLLAFHDIHLQGVRTGVLMHNRIDRFTGGVINGALFSEEVLWQTPLELRISVLPGAESIEPIMRLALQRTLEDLANGWLTLGAGGSRGLGTFRSRNDQGPQWSDAGEWVNSLPTKETHA